ncbi:MAG: lysylphosphatidylglycerol synthase domain-containing protein [bacterium]
MRKLSIVFLILGVALLGGLIYKVGPTRLWTDLMRIGPSFFWVLLAGLCSFFFLALAWKDLLYPERSTATILDLFLASLVGFSINELTPGSVAGEPIKGAQLRGKIPAEDIVSSLILHNYLYLITNFLQMLIGALVGLIWLDMSPLLMWGTLAVTVVVAAILAGLTLAIRWGMAERFMRALRFLRLPIKNIESVIERAKQVDEQARTFARERRMSFWRAFGWIFMARTMAVVEIWLILLIIGHPAGFATLMLLQASSLLVYVIFFFVPSQMGANELGSTVIFKLLNYNPQTGLLMELVRRLRKISVIIIGLCVFGIRTALRPTAPKAAVEGKGDNA